MEGTSFGRYRFLELLGRGGIGEVWKAFDTETDRVVAVKVLPKEFSNDAMFQQQFRREVRAAAVVGEPHRVRIHRYGEIDGRPYVDMRWYGSRDLRSILADGPLDPDRAVKIIEQVASALDAAHQEGLVCRDVKPSNILVTRDDFAYLIDDGIARSVGETGLTNTWAYMAPERIESGTVDPRSDVYSLACVLFECLTGRKPYQGDSFEQSASAHLWMSPPRPSEFRSGLPHGLDFAVTKGLAKDPDKRFASARALAHEARQAITSTAPQLPVHPSPDGTEPPTVAHPDPSVPPDVSGLAPTKIARPRPRLVVCPGFS